VRREEEAREANGDLQLRCGWWRMGWWKRIG